MIECQPPGNAPVYSYRRDPDVAYSEDEITERHKVRMTRYFLGDDGVWREHIVWVTQAFAARHGYRPDVKMIRYYYDRNRIQQEQIVFVTREFAARWGYTPVESSESASSAVAPRPGNRLTATIRCLSWVAGGPIACESQPRPDPIQ